MSNIINISEMPYRKQMMFTLLDFLLNLVVAKCYRTLQLLSIYLQDFQEYYKNICGQITLDNMFLVLSKPQTNLVIEVRYKFIKDRWMFRTFLALDRLNWLFRCSIIKVKRNALATQEMSWTCHFSLEKDSRSLPNILGHPTLYIIIEPINYLKIWHQNFNIVYDI